MRKESLKNSVMTLLFITLLAFSLSASAKGKHGHHGHQNNGELITFLDTETTIQDRRAYYRYRLSDVLTANTNYCELYSSYFSENKQLKRFKRCLRISLNNLRHWRVISNSERKELRAILKAYTGDETPVSVSTVNGTITLSDGSTASNVLITATAADGTVVEQSSDANGNYSLTLTPNTDYDVTFSTEGYIDRLENIVSPAEDTAITLDIELEQIPQPVSFVNGRITLADGSTVSNIVVTAKAADGSIKEATSDDSGNFNLELTPDTEYTVQFSAEGYADQVSNVISPAEDNTATINITMIERNANQDVINDGSATIGVDGASVTANASQFVDADGNSVAGTLQVSITPVDVSNSASLEAFPGEFSGIPIGELADSPIYSLGVVEYEFSVVAVDGTVTPVNLASNETATIEIPIYDNTYQGGAEIQIRDTIPLWSLNEDTGLWVQEGQGVVVASASSPTGLALQATVSHFSWWNCDVSMDAADSEITVTGSQTGTAVVTADASACDIGWRPSTVDTILNLGVTSQPSPVPSNCEVCFSANVTYADGSIASTNEVCVTPTANQQLPINLTAAVEGNLDIVANYVDDSLSITTLIGYPVERVRLSSTTLENTVTYSVSTNGDSLPNGFSLNSLNAVSAEIAGITDTAGTYTVVIDAIDASGTETDSVTIIYEVIDPSTSEAPVFITSPATIDLPFDYESTSNYDLNLYNLGGAIAEWTVASNGFIPQWLNLTSDGILSSSLGFGDDFSNTWNGTLIGSNASGDDELSIQVCVGFGCPNVTPAPGDFALSVENASSSIAFEENVIVFEVTLNQASDEDISFSYATSDGVIDPGSDFPEEPAIAGQDYEATSGIATILAGEESVFITVPLILFNGNFEFFQKTLQFTISDNSSGRIQDGQATGFIQYDFLAQ